TKEIFIFIGFRVAFGAFRAWVGRPDNAVLPVHHIQYVFGRTKMINLTVGGILLDELLISRARRRMRKIDWLGSHQIPMAAQIRVRLLSRHYQEVFIGHPACTFEIDFFFLESFGTRIAWIGIIMEVA